MSRSILRVTLLVVLALMLQPPTALQAKRKPRIPVCPGGTFVVVGDPLIPGSVSSFEDRLQVGGGHVAFSSGCPVTRMRAKPTRRGTRLRARWSSCPGLSGHVRLTATIDPLTCSVMVGKLRAKKMRRTFQAVLENDAQPPDSATCGNGVVEGFEACDDGNTADCDGCSADCTRLDAQCGDGIPECGEECDGTGCPSNEHCAGCRCVPDDATPQVCTEASSCSDRHTCSDAGDCRCIRSAEGDIRCGKAPSCDVPKCATSADCAPLGAGYFCDTPNSGCCSDGELTRCLSPCDAVPDPDNVLPTLSADAQHLLLEADKAHRGLPADLDGDGTPDLFTTDLGGGALMISVDSDGDGRPEYLEQRDAQGNDTLVIDTDSDGKPEEQTAFTVGPPPVRITTWDTDLDGTMDRRETATYDPDAGTVHVVVEVDPENDGSFVTASDTTEPIPRDAGPAKCDGAQGFPLVPSLGSSLRFGSAGDVSVPYNDDGSGGRCTKPRAQRIVKAVDCALDHGFKCLENTNDALAKRLLSTFAHETLYFGCGNSCAGTDATTIPWLGIPGFRDGKINFNPNDLDAMSDDELCGVTLHEMLHWAGEGLGDTAAHDKGDDRTYSCGRYCGRCNSRGPDPAADGKPAGPNADCARCAGTEAEKARCGIKKDEVDIICPELSLCHAGLAGNLACTTCRGLQPLFCDGTTPALLGPTFLCCETCPSGYRNTDEPCPKSGSGALSCGQKPPECP